MSRISAFSKAVLLIASALWLSVTAEGCQPTGDLLTIRNNGKDVRVKSQETSVLSQASATIGLLKIEGTLILNDMDMNLTVEGIVVEDGGHLIIGSSPICPFESKLIITFSGKRDLGTDRTGGVQLGVKGLAVKAGGNITVHGQNPGRTWTTLRETAHVGETQISLKAPVLEWKTGGRVLLTSTDYGDLTVYDDNESSNPTLRDQSEELYIQSVSNDGLTINLSKPLAYKHYAGAEYQGEVALLSRNIVFQGDMESEMDGIGGHFILRPKSTSQIRIAYAEFIRMGQANTMGRYPLHFHLGNQVDKSSDQTSQLIGNSVHNGYHRCIAIHDTDYVHVEDNVCYRVKGHMFMLEDGSERFNLFKHNLGSSSLYIRGPRVIATDDITSIFWIGSPHNYFLDNSASQAKIGFWFIMPQYPNGASREVYRDNAFYQPRMWSLLQFQNNVAHSCDDGLHIDQQQDVDSGATIDGESDGYIALTDENVALSLVGRNFDTSPPGSAHSHLLSKNIPIAMSVFENFLAYKNRDYGVWVKGANHLYQDFRLFDNLVAIQMITRYSILQNSRIVGKTANTGLSTPVYWTNDAVIKGFEHYDSGSVRFMRNITFSGFHTNDDRRAGVHSVIKHGLLGKSPVDQCQKCQVTDGSNMVAIENALDMDQGDRYLFNGREYLPDGTRQMVNFNGDNTFSYSMGDGSALMRHKQGCQPEGDYYQCYGVTAGFSYIQARLSTGTSPYDMTVADQPYAAKWRALDDQTVVFEGRGYSGYKFEAVAPSHTAVVLSFTKNMPKLIQLTLPNGAPGDWNIVALPIPAERLVRVANYDGQTLTYVGDLSELTIDTFHSDGRYIFVKLGITEYSASRWHYRNMHGVNAYESWDAGVTIEIIPCGDSYEEGCGNEYSSAPLQTATVATMEDLYHANIPGIARGHLHLNRRTNELSLNVLHNEMYANVSVVGVNNYRQKLARSTGGPVKHYQVGLEASQLNALKEGQMSLEIITDDGNKHEAAFAGCEGFCPPSEPAVDVCQVLDTDYIWYTDGLMTGITTSNTWGSAKWVDADISDKECGTASFRVEYPEGNVNSAFSIARAMALPVSAVRAQYNAFVFLAKAENTCRADKCNTLEMVFTADGVWLSSYIPLDSLSNDEYRISNEWQEFVVPLSNFGFHSDHDTRVVDMFHIRPMVRDGQIIRFDQVRFTNRQESDSRRRGAPAGRVLDADRSVSRRNNGNNNGNGNDKDMTNNGNNGNGNGNVNKGIGNGNNGNGGIAGMQKVNVGRLPKTEADLMAMQQHMSRMEYAHKQARANAFMRGYMLNEREINAIKKQNRKLAKQQGGKSKTNV